MSEIEIEILGLTLKGDCTSPEEYTAYRGDQRVGYLRLRHGCFSAEYQHGKGRNCRFIVVYTSCTRGSGVFFEEEREMELTKAVIEIIKAERIVNWVEKNAGAQ